jgi:hypothetical protein
METNDLLAALYRLSVEVRPTACQGCGRAHECSIHFSLKEPDANA